MPKISVLMPVYNTQEDYLREAIESILNQSFKDFELILLDDGSTNNAPDVIKSYKDTRIKYVKNEKNLGLIKTLNKGLEIATGELIARMDSDDISLPERFEKQVKFLDENPNIDILGTNFTRFPKIRPINLNSDSKKIKECMLVNSNDIAHPTVIIRKSAVEKFNIKYDEEFSYVEDYALWLSLIDKVKFANLQESLLNYRVHKQSICQSKKVEQNLNVQKTMTIAQGKHFNLDVSEVLNTIEKLRKCEKISTQELSQIIGFAKTIKQKAEEEKFSCEYILNKVFFKFAKKQCKKDLGYFRKLIRKELSI